jgi:lipopolysaccharide export system protein LptC
VSMPGPALRAEPPVRVARRAALGENLGKWRSRDGPDGDPHTRHSRFVALLKRLLPTVGATLLVLIAVWPRLAPLWERIRFAFPAIDLRDARELDMINPRYAGIDRDGRPFIVTAVSARQVPDRQDLVSLKSPHADLKSHGGATIVITSQTGVYQSQTQLLDLFNDVTLVHQNGTRFVTQTARVEAANNGAEGDKPVDGHGPSGDIKAQGFRIFDRGDKILFTGRADMLLRGAELSVPSPPPAALPAAVAATAARTTAEAKPMLAAARSAPPQAVPAVSRRPASQSPPGSTASRPAARHAPARHNSAAPT